VVVLEIVIVIIIIIAIVSILIKQKKIIKNKKPNDITNLIDMEINKNYGNHINSNRISHSKQIFDDFVALDTETTGFNPTNDKIIKIIKSKNVNCKELKTSIHKEESIPKEDIFTEEELGCYKFVKNIIVKHNRDIKYLRYTHTGQYFNVIASYNILRIKLKGKKHYFISNKSIEQLKLLNPEFQYEACPKSETGTTRIIILNNYKDLINFENLIIENFDTAIKEKDSYISHVVCSQQNINNYLSADLK
jgi:hypothetical protein